MSDDHRDLLPRHTAPTWEVELLISGVAVFAMLQLPGWLDDRVFALMPRIGDHWNTLLKLLYIYAKSAAVILAATFVVHLTLRARWVALVGLYSVYPDGIRWERLKMGPLQREIEQQRSRPTDEIIERADNAATIVFAVGVMIAIMLLVVLAVLGGLYSAAIVATRAGSWQIDPAMLVLGMFFALTTPFALAIAADRGQLGWLSHGWGRRVAGWLLRGYARFGMSRSNSRIMVLLASHGGERRVMLFTSLIMAAAIFAVALDYDAMRSPTRVGSYALFPTSRAAGVAVVDATHYADRRDPARDEAAAFVQSTVITGPYLRLLLPYRPARDEPALRRDCPAIHESAAHARARGILACLQRLHPVLLDGKPLPALRFEIASDPGTDRPALLAMIDVRALAPGRHELQVGHPPGGGKDPDERAQDKAEVIPFWR